METKGTENKNIENKNTENKNTAAVKKTGKKRSTASIAAEFFIKVGITALVVAILLIFIVGIYVNHSNSGYPMIKDGDLCITYKLASLSAGDEIVYMKDGKVYFGRKAESGRSYQ